MGEVRSQRSELRGGDVGAVKMSGWVGGQGSVIGRRGLGGGSRGGGRGGYAGWKGAGGQGQ